MYSLPLTLFVSNLRFGVEWLPSSWGWSLTGTRPAVEVAAPREETPCKQTERGGCLNPPLQEPRLPAQLPSAPLLIDPTMKKWPKWIVKLLSCFCWNFCINNSYSLVKSKKVLHFSAGLHVRGDQAFTKHWRETLSASSNHIWLCMVHLLKPCDRVECNGTDGQMNCERVRHKDIQMVN